MSLPYVGPLDTLTPVNKSHDVAVYNIATSSLTAATTSNLNSFSLIMNSVQMYISFSVT